MSKCISAHGEYSEHEGTGEFCVWCGACNHDAIIAAAEQRGAAKALRDAAEDLFYDGDTDRPMPGYSDLLDRADRIANKEGDIA